MKEINEHRFQKKPPEPIAFRGITVPDPPAATPEPTPPVRTDERTNGRTAGEHPAPNAEVPSYVVRIPAERHKTRHPFDVYEDQLDALRKIQLAEREAVGRKGSKTMGEMAQEALDRFIADKTKKLPSIKLLREE